jgi:hypothetical protein
MQTGTTNILMRFCMCDGTYIVKGEHKAISVCTHIYIPFLLVYKSIQLWHVMNISGPKKLTMHFVTLRNQAFDYFHFLSLNQYNDDHWRRWWSIIRISWSASINISRKQRSYSHALAPDQGGEREMMKESDIQDSQKNTRLPRKANCHKWMRARNERSECYTGGPCLCVPAASERRRLNDVI